MSSNKDIIAAFGVKISYENYERYYIYWIFKTKLIKLVYEQQPWNYIVMESGVIPQNRSGLPTQMSHNEIPILSDNLLIIEVDMLLNTL